MKSPDENNQNSSCTPTDDSSTDTCMKTGSDLKAWREKKDWTQDELAQHLDMHSRTIAQIESKNKHKPLSEYFWMKWEKRGRK